jgi:hypothetical protein
MRHAVVARVWFLIDNSAFTIQSSSIMELTPVQLSMLEKILNAGFRFVTVERAERYVGWNAKGSSPCANLPTAESSSSAGLDI